MCALFRWGAPSFVPTAACRKESIRFDEETGIFEMRESGLVEVSNPSELFLSERSMGVSGSTVVASMEGTRPVLVEL
ncbi:putative ATP-dependent serine protease [Paenibacillus sp. PvR018]|nr:putative ATP-dependent serine protease [Paenibacillus sp. PvP091]